MVLRALLAGFAAVFSMASNAATSAIAVTPPQVGVLGGDSYTFTAQFFDATGRPAANENVQFLNDVCGSFSNGSAVISVRTDANGIASAAFTARNQGITCWVSAVAGAQVRWNVVTFPLGLVHLQTSMTPPQPRPGEAFVLSVVPMAGAYRIYEGEVTARVVAGTASATVANPNANSGQSGSVAFNVIPDHRVGNYEVEVAYRGKTQRVALTAPELPWQDMWWGGAAESGWGVSIVQHRDTLFTAIYGYDAAGAPTWWVMPGGEWNASKTAFAGALYQPRGSSYEDYDAADLVVGPAAGHATLTFVDGGHIALDYSIGTSTGRKSLVRQPFAPVDTAPTANYGDMWWGGAAQSGWGISMLHQYQTLFAVWFTYDAAGKPTWFVMPAGFWSNAATYEGRIHKASGAPFLGAAYDSRLFKTTDVGTFRIRFGIAGATSDTATFDYTIAGRSGTMPLSRQPF